MPPSTAVGGRLSRRGGFVAVALAFAVAMVGTTLPTPLYVLYRDEFGFSDFLITVIFATYAVGVIGALLVFGRLSDEIGRRRTLIPGLVLSGLSAVVFLLAHGVAPLFVGRFLSGLSAGIFTGTATATLVDLTPEDGRGRATLVGTLVNMGGLGLGPLLAGILAQAFGAPLRLVFVVDLVLVGIVIVGVLAMSEPGTVRERPRLRPQGISVPPEVRATFVPAALAAFAGFAVLGLFTAVAPGVMGQLLGVTSHAVVGLVVFGVFLGSATGQAALEAIPGDRALRLGCVLLAVGMAVLAAGVATTAFAPVIAGGVIAGFGQGLSFRAGLAAVNAASPGDRRAEIASSFFVVAYVAISLPVVGVGVLAAVTDLETASLIFAGVVAALAVVTLGLLGRGATPGSEPVAG